MKSDCFYSPISICEHILTSCYGLLHSMIVMKHHLWMKQFFRCIFFSFLWFVFSSLHWNESPSRFTFTNFWPYQAINTHGCAKWRCKTTLNYGVKVQRCLFNIHCSSSMASVILRNVTTEQCADSYQLADEWDCIRRFKEVMRFWRFIAYANAYMCMQCAWRANAHAKKLLN